MKISIASFLTLVLFLLTTESTAQHDKDFDNVIQLGELYTNNLNYEGEEFDESIESLRTPNLDHIIDVLLAIRRDDTKLLTPEFLRKPSKLELRYWFVLSMIKRNKFSKNTKKTNVEIAFETFEKHWDDRRLLRNYYRQLYGGIAMIFNDEDLSEFNIDFSELSLEDESEKAILFLEVTNALITRFRVLSMMNNASKLIEYAEKMPTFNGKPYYEFTSFDFEDFEVIGEDGLESYKEKSIYAYYQSLISHFSAASKEMRENEMKNIYWNSILSTPNYFKMAGTMRKTLKKLYKKASH